MLKIFKKQDMPKSVEDELLQLIEMKVKQFTNHISKIKNLNLMEASSSGYQLTEQQAEEMTEIINSMNDLLDMLIILKDYVKAFYNEIAQNPSLSPYQKTLWVNKIRQAWQMVKDKVERLFMEIEIISQQLGNY